MQLRRHLARKHSCLVLKYKKDTQYSLDDVISTHDRSELAAKPVEQLEEVCSTPLSRAAESNSCMTSNDIGLAATALRMLGRPALLHSGSITLAVPA